MKIEHAEEFIRNLNTNTSFSGILNKTSFLFVSIQKFKTKKKEYKNLEGKLCITISSPNRKRPINLFLDVLYHFLQDGPDSIGYDKLPESYRLAYSKRIPQSYPNIYEYQTHYKSFALFILNSFERN
jgi:hypothetical protein